jgi:hypothetical protein
MAAVLGSSITRKERFKIGRVRKWEREDGNFEKKKPGIKR